MTGARTPTAPRSTLSMTSTVAEMARFAVSVLLEHGALGHQLLQQSALSEAVAGLSSIAGVPGSVPLRGSGSMLPAMRALGRQLLQQSALSGTMAADSCAVLKRAVTFRRSFLRGQPHRNETCHKSNHKGSRSHRFLPPDCYHSLARSSASKSVGYGLCGSVQPLPRHPYWYNQCNFH